MPRRPTAQSKRLSAKQRKTFTTDHLDALRRSFVQSISWTQDGDVSAVTFFSPTEVLRARQVAAMEAATAAQTAAPQRSDAFGMNPGIWDETPEMEELRKKAEKATGDEAMHYARQWHKLHQEMITYRSS